MSNVLHILKQFRGTAFLWAVMLGIAAIYPFATEKHLEGLATYFNWLYHCDASHLWSNLWYTLPYALIVEHRLKTTKYLIFVVAVAFISSFLTHCFAEPSLTWKEMEINGMTIPVDIKEVPYRSAGFSGVSYAFQTLTFIFLLTWRKENLRHLPYIFAGILMWVKIAYLYKVAINYTPVTPFTKINHIGHISGMIAAVILYITYKSLQKLNREKEWF